LVDNETGNLIRDTFRFEYDANGFLKHAKLNGDESEFIYDPTTLTLVEKKTDTAWPDIILNSYTYNKDKDLIELHVQDPLSHTVTTEKITWSADHKMLSDDMAILSQNDDVDSAVSRYVYDAKGNLAEEETVSTSYNDRGHTRRNVKRQDYYDTRGRLIEEFVFENDMEKERFVFSYTGSSNEPVSESYFSKGVLQRVDNFELDPKTGLPITLTEEEAGRVSRFRYAFEQY
jgi:hypothetical protein